MSLHSAGWRLGCHTLGETSARDTQRAAAFRFVSWSTCFLVCPWTARLYDVWRQPRSDGYEALAFRSTGEFGRLIFGGNDSIKVGAVLSTQSLAARL